MTRSVDLYDQPFCFNIERHPDSQPVDHQLSKIQSYYLQIHSQKGPSHLKLFLYSPFWKETPV